MNLRTAFAGILLTIMLGLLLASSNHKRLSYDEFPHLYYGYRFLTQGPQTIPDGQRAAIVALNALFCLHVQCDPVAMQRDTNHFLVRIPTLIFALLLGFLIFRCAFELFGYPSAGLSLALYVFSANFLAHGKQVTTDVPLCFFMTATFYFFRRYLRSKSPANFVLTALCTTGALISKLSAFMLIGLLPVLAWLYRDKEPKSETISNRAGPRLGQGFTFAFLVWLFLNLAYGFSGTFDKFKDQPWQSRSFQNKFQTLSLPLLVPRPVALGLDQTAYLQENPSVGRGSNYFIGKLRRKGRGYAFPLMLLFKIPLAFWGLIAMAVRNRLRSPGWTSKELVFWALPSIVYFLTFSLFSHAQ